MKIDKIAVGEMLMPFLDMRPDPALLLPKAFPGKYRVLAYHRIKGPGHDGLHPEKIWNCGEYSSVEAAIDLAKKTHANVNKPSDPTSRYRFTTDYCVYDDQGKLCFNSSYPELKL